METAKLNRTIRFKFGKALRIGTKVEIIGINGDTAMIRTVKEPTLEYLIMKDALTKTDNVQTINALQCLTILSASYGHLFSKVHAEMVNKTMQNLI